jgi:mannosyltransferase
MSLAAAGTRERVGPPVTAGPRPELTDLIIVAALTAVAFVLHISQIHQSLFGDEVFTYHDVVGHSFSSLLSGVYTGGENSPPLFFVLAWLSAKLGDPTVWIRLPSILFGTATVPVVYLLGRQAVARGVGLVGAAIFTLSPFCVYYGVEARPYATMAFFVALSTFALLKALDSRSWAWWFVYALAAAAAAYTHYTSVFVLALQAAWSLWAARDRIRGPVLANVLIVLLYVPWLPHLRGKGLKTFEQFERLTAANALKDLVRVVAGYPYASLRGIPTVAGLVAIGACGLIGIGFAIWRRVREQPSARTSSRLRLLIALTVVTPIGLFFYSLIVTDLWLARGLYASLPAATLVLAALLARLPRPLAVATIAVTLVTLLACSFRAISPDYVRTPFRAIAAYLDQNAGPRDPVLYSTYVGPPAISAQTKKPHLVLSSVLALHGLPRPGERAFVVQDDVLAHLLHFAAVPKLPHFRPIAHRHYRGIFPTDLWEYAPAS